MQREEAPDQLERLPHGVGAGVRAKVFRSVFLDTAGHQEPRECLLHGQLQVRIMLVVLDPDVVPGLMLLDQVALQNEGLDFVIGDDRLQIRHLFHQSPDLDGVFCAWLKVGANPMPEGNRFPHIDDPPVLVLEKIYAWLVRKQCQLITMDIRLTPLII